MKKLILLITVLAFWGCDNSTEATDSCENVDCSNLTVGCEVGVCENGECMVQNSQTGTVCDDGDACTSNDTCNGQGTCLSGSSIDCDDANMCTDDSCNGNIGCVYTSNTYACDDGDACTSGDVCNEGSCVGGQQIPNCP